MNEKRFVELPSGERLFDDGRLQNTKSGNGVLLDSFRRPLNMGGHYYYRMTEGKYANIEKLVSKHFDIKIKANREWFTKTNAIISKYNADLKQKYDETELERERMRKRKQKAIKNLLDGKITRGQAVAILGLEAVSKLVLGEPDKQFRKRKFDEPDYETFNEFTSTEDLGEAPPEAWGF